MVVSLPPYYGMRPDSLTLMYALQFLAILNFILPDFNLSTSVVYRDVTEIDPTPSPAPYTYEPSFGGYVTSGPVGGYATSGPVP